MSTVDLEATSIDVLHNVVESCFPYFDLLDVVRCCASSKALAHVCKAHLLEASKHLSHQLLQQAVQQAASATAKLRSIIKYRLCQAATQRAPVDSIQHQQQRTQACVSWLLRTIEGHPLFTPPTQRSEETVRCLTQLPYVPFELSKQLTEAGMRVSYKQVVEAARQLIAEADVWLKAQQQLGMATDVPEYASTLLFSTRQPEGFVVDLDPNVLPGQLADLLFLAINTTPAMQWHGLSIIRAACAHQSGQQLAKQDVLDLLLAAAKKQHQTKLITYQRGIALLPGICQLPATEGLAPDDLEGLLLAVVKMGDVMVLDDLLNSIPTARDVDGAAVVAMLTAAIKLRDRQIVEALCFLEAARRLESQAVSGLLRVAAEVGFDPGSEDLCCLPGFQGVRQTAEPRSLEQR